ncbi:hypothetical protein PVL29_011596 [Vitis rotundifolia]|uniref:C3H1-type domain-containing protein n=1 Tax=Vitis rotundifolia TaxID=103349 RepID=A0AA39DR26_VITRO|nr:hypothetical protein PVL29_011596 [Vitis rotundifolia]
MSFPTNTPPVFAPYAESCGDALECWPQFPMDRSSENCPRIETPSFKKPKISETVTNLRMPGSNNEVMTYTFFKTQLCMKFRLGTCINGDECNFAHGTGDIRRPLPHGQELSCKEGYVAGIWNRDHRLNSKMKLCRIFSRGEKCPYGERCNFLHEGLEKCRDGSGVTCKLRAVNTVILATDDMRDLLPRDDPLLRKCIDLMDALAISTINWAPSVEKGS